MRAPLRLAIGFALLMPVASFAAPLQVHLPEHRVLSSSEKESFEPALIEQLAETLGRPALFVARSKDADLRLLPDDQPGAAVYYRAAPAALSATEGGLAAWADLRGQTVCIGSASPYAILLSEHFAAVPREYPSAAHALIGLKLGECVAVVDDDVLLMEIASLPEWQRYKHLLPRLADAERQMSLNFDDEGLQQQTNDLLAQWSADGRLEELTRHWIDEVAFQAYVLADTLDCH